MWQSYSFRTKPGLSRPQALTLRMTNVLRNFLILIEKPFANGEILGYTRDGDAFESKKLLMQCAVWRREMLKKLQAWTVLLCMISYAEAGTVSIGTASVRGDMRVDSYRVKGNATLFDGSVVETGEATANLRLKRGTQITLATSSRGTLYSDRLVLQQGESELSSGSSFQLQANGLHVTPSQPNSDGVVSLKSDNTVEVAALTGSFGVTNDQGVLLASVHPGLPLSFAMQAGGAPAAFSAQGTISEVNGQFFLTAKDGTKYQVTGNNLAQAVGKTVKVSGTVSSSTAGGTAVITVATTQVLVAGIFTTTALVITGVTVAAAAGLAAGITAANSGSPPASP